MRLSKSDLIAGSIGAFALATLSYLLYAEMTSRSGRGSTELIGAINSTRNIAERKFSAQVVWDEVEKNASVYNFDTIRTADQSEAIIRLKDGTEITLNENSMVLLSLSEKEFDIQFMQGAINAKQAAVKTAGARTVNISSGGSIITLKNGDVSLSQDRDKGLNLTVSRGTAAFLSEKGEQVLTENQNIQSGKDGIKLYDLTVKLILPEKDAYIPIGADQAAVRFIWELPKGGFTPFLEIANNPSLADPIIKKRAAGNAAPAYLPEGIYYWRVTAINNVTKKVEASEIRRLSILDNRPAELIAPANGSIIQYRDANPMINFIWSRNESVSRYGLTVSRKTDMSDAVANTIVDGTKISINSLGKGVYYWKIASVPEVAYGQKSAESAVHTFTVAKIDKLPPPEPVYPPENKSIHPLAIVRKGLNFTWLKDSSIPQTQIMIAADKDFSKVIANKTSTDNSIRITDSLKEGVYYWNLRGLMSDGSSTDYSSAFRFRVATEGALRLVEPNDNAILIDNKGRGIPITFSWIKSELEGGYLLRISKDRNFSSLVKELPAADTSTEMPRIEDGTYYWLVRLIDEKGAGILSSPVYSFKVVGKLGLPVAVEPKSGSTVNMVKQDALELRWAAVKGANLYRVGLFQINNGIQHSIAAVETADTAYRFPDLKKLDEGRFFWSLRALDADSTSRRVIRKSDEARMEFEITLGGEKKIKIKSPRILYLE
ncbi:MAG: hypothetical protein A2W19_05090 [Spirochaetes bacterium RBG_16_49_21]|nr:MAG: hypothetical protein A2W19_05090 [Spirochaetes bacterium RBG_16_49_21]